MSEQQQNQKNDKQKSRVGALMGKRLKGTPVSVVIGALLVGGVTVRAFHGVLGARRLWRNKDE